MNFLFAAESASISKQWSDFWSSIGKLFAEAGWRLIVLLAILIVGIVVIRFFVQFIRKVLLKSRMNTTLAVFFIAIIQFILYFTLILILAGIAGVAMAPLVTVLAAISLVIALAIQGTISNVANGVLIIASKPFRVGDYVMVNGVEGTVKSIRMTVTELLTNSNEKIVIPNTRITSDNMINYTARPTRRINMDFTIALPDNFDKVKDIINNILIADPRIFDDPAPQIVISEFKDNCLTFTVMCWVNTNDYHTVRNELTESVLNAFKENDIRLDYSKISLVMADKDEKEDKK